MIPRLSHIVMLAAIFVISACSFKGKKQTTQSSSTKKYSALWGKKGELWNKSRIPDFTKAGYMEGKPLPHYTRSANVKQYGAKGDGVTDDTKAFRLAIAACKTQGAVYIPAGRYLLSDTLLIKKSGICLQGEAMGNTILLFSKGLEELYPNYNVKWKNQTQWSWSWGMICFADVEGSGIQDLAIEFPDRKYEGHNFHERGYNAVGFSGTTTNCWLSAVKIMNADLGVWVEETASHITITDWSLHFNGVRATQAIAGHHGVNIYGGYNLLQNFEINGSFVHDLSVESAKSVYNVFRNGRGLNLCIDHHNHDQSHNLFTNLHAGKGTRLYASGGNATPAGISFYETYWNITADEPMTYCNRFNNAQKKSANNVAVGIKTNLPTDTSNMENNWFETIQPHQLVPQDLYKAQLKVQKKR